MKRFIHLVALLLISALSCKSTVMDLTPGVPNRGSCVPGEHRCMSVDGGVTPVFCSRDHREWSSMPRAPNGVQRVCAHGCAINDAGVAQCVGE